MSSRAKKIFGLAAVVLVVAAAMTGLYLSGSPSKERLRQFDTRRANDLQQISYAVNSFYAKYGRLPESLGELAGGDYGVQSVHDPKSGQPYEYRVVTPETYELCGVFALEADGQQQYYPGLRPVAVPSETVPLGKLLNPSEEFYRHGSGRTCFSINEVPTAFGQVCGPNYSCPAYQSCVILPNATTPVCVPPSKECDAAGCPGRCLITESFPARVRCDADGGQPVSDCRLMRDPKSGSVNCFGCARGLCSDPPAGWSEYRAPQEAGQVGIPYACFESEKGCSLAQ